MSIKRSRHVLQAVMATGTLLLLGCSAAPETGRTNVRDYAAEAAGQADANQPVTALLLLRTVAEPAELTHD
jgi:hypothetical protein